jgi:tungstate transport system ATP-binding protein
MIQITRIKMEYNQRTVLDIPSKTFETGKRYALLGANGSGKSTLLKLLAGIINATEGEITSQATGKKAMGYLPQTPYGFSFSVLKNVLIALDNEPDQEKIALEAIATVGLNELIEVNAAKLSGGETQRLAFARIIALPRKLLLLDEPTAATDLLGIGLLEEALLSYCHKNNCTVIFATHSPAQAMRLANETVFLHQGLIVEQGETKQVLNNPQSELVQAFLKNWKL